ncbi:MAG: F0F1 ATP synthase subunit epsilon [Proteobacteria bacterium]|nr:F0F1 ATP synthase subunit epsilon [Pseudomonadota bacterium]
MAMTMHVDIVSAEKEIFSGPVEVLIAPVATGEVGIHPRHAPLLAPLKPGEITIRTGDKERMFYVSGGVLEVQPHVVTVLADTAVRAKDLDEAKAVEAKQRAEAAMQDQQSEVDYARAAAELAEAVAQPRTIEKIRKQMK